MTGNGSFFERIDFLAQEVGHGTLRMKVEVDQVYAHYQEVGDEFNHPRGGQSRYLRDSLYNDIDGHMAALAEHAVTPGGSEIRDGAKVVAERIADGVHQRAPIEFYHLKRSAHPTVLDEGAVIYDRPPAVHRLSEEELKHLRKRGELP